MKVASERLNSPAMDYYSAFRRQGAAVGFDAMEKRWIRLAHTSVIIGAVAFPPIGAVIGPLLIDRFHGERSSIVERETMEAVNFGITLSIAMLLSRLLVMIDEWTMQMPENYTLPETAVLVFGAFYVWRARKAIRRYERYRYPYIWRLVRPSPFQGRLPEVR